MGTDAKKEIERLERNRVTAAKVVKLHGEKYICHFKRLNTELSKLKGDTDLMAEIERLAA